MYRWPTRCLIMVLPLTATTTVIHAQQQYSLDASCQTSPVPITGERQSCSCSGDCVRPIGSHGCVKAQSGYWLQLRTLNRVEAPDPSTTEEDSCVLRLDKWVVVKTGTDLKEPTTICLSADARSIGGAVNKGRVGQVTCAISVQESDLP